MEQDKKELEQSYMCDSAKGRVSYFLTRYRNAHDERGRIAILIDGKEIHRSSDLETELENIYWSEENATINANSKGQLYTYYFAESYMVYCNQTIEKSINSENAVIRLFAIFDRRIGKRRINELKDTLIADASWLKPFYDFRLECEFKNPNSEILTITV